MKILPGAKELKRNLFLFQLWKSEASDDVKNTIPLRRYYGFLLLSKLYKIEPVHEISNNVAF